MPRAARTRRRAIALAVAALTITVAAACEPAPDPPGVLTRPGEPVVLRGFDLHGSALGHPVGDFVAFNYTVAGWTQVPVQIDQRKFVEMNTVYGRPPATVEKVTVLVYADPDTFTGAGTGMLAGLDEISFMSGDAGGSAPTFSEPPGVVSGSGMKLTVTDPEAGGAQSFVYLFRRSGGLSPGAGKDRVTYDFALTSGDYKTTYRLNDGPNPETSSVKTVAYTRTFGDRWLDDGLRIRVGGASNVDILDRHKPMFAPGNCGRTEDTFDDAEGAFIANIDGPVRAIRSYVGANSGPYTQRTHIFYARREDIITELRVHAIPGIMDFFDYSPAASGMTYVNDRNLAGVPIDGLPDTVAAGAPVWEKVDGPQGSLTHVWRQITDIVPAPTATNYYYDDARVPDQPVDQCTGDAVSFGSSGTRITSGIPNTDPSLTVPTTNNLLATRTMYYEAPGRTNADAQHHADQIAHPVEVTSTLWKQP